MGPLALTMRHRVAKDARGIVASLKPEIIFEIVSP